MKTVFTTEYYTRLAKLAETNPLAAAAFTKKTLAIEAAHEGRSDRSNFCRTPSAQKDEHGERRTAHDVLRFSEQPPITRTVVSPDGSVIKEPVGPVKLPKLDLAEPSQTEASRDVVATETSGVKFDYDYEALSQQGLEVIQAEFGALHEARSTFINQLIEKLEPLIAEYNALSESAGSLRAEQHSLVQQVEDLKTKLKRVTPRQGRKKVDPPANIKAQMDEYKAQIGKCYEALQDNRRQIEGTHAVQRQIELRDQILAASEPVFMQVEQFMRQEGSLISWTIQQAVEQSAQDLATYYEYVALAVRSFREAVSFDADQASRLASLFLIQKDDEDDAGDGQNRKVCFFNSNPLGAWIKLNDYYESRQLMQNMMTLPKEQQGRGRFYNVEQELARLGLEHLAADLCDRVPLPPRTGLKIDANFTTEREWLQFFDLELRTAIGFNVHGLSVEVLATGGEIMPGDQIISVLTHGTATSNSTVGSVVQWSNALLRGFNRPNLDEDPRRVATIVYAQPHHGFGSKDANFLPTVMVDENTDDVFFVELPDRHYMERYISAVLDRYTVYREQGKPVIFGGRSTGGSQARIHRAATDGTSQQADGYINLSALPCEFGDLWTAYFDTRYLQISAPQSAGSVNLLVINPEGLISTMAQFNSARYLNGFAANPDTNPIIHMGGGLDTDYPHIVLPVLDVNHPEAQRWIEYHTQVGVEFKRRRKRSHDHEMVKAIYTQIIIGFRAMLKERNGWSDEEVDAHWADYVATRVSLEDFWKGQQEQDSHGRTLYHYDAEAAHNMVDDSVNDKDVVARSLEAMYNFMNRVIAGFIN